MERTYAITLSLTLTLLGADLRAEDVVWRAATPKTTPPQQVDPPAEVPTVRGQSDEMDVPPLLGLTSDNTPELLPAPTPMLPPSLPKDAGIKAKPKPKSATVVQHPRPSVPVESAPPETIWKSADPKVTPASCDECAPPPPPRPFYSPNITLVQESVLGLDPYQPGYVNRSYVKGEYLLWWVNRDVVPPLVTTGLPVGFDQLPPPGALSRPDTRILIGDEGFEQGEPRNGFRLRAGTWLDDCHSCGIDGSLWFLSPFRSDQEIAAGQFDVLARPIFAPNPEINGQFVEIIAFPGISTGGVDVGYDSMLWGGDINFRKCLCSKCDLKAECFAGFRYVDLDEDLQITEFLLAQEASINPPPGSQIVVRDRFDTRNQFYGGQVGTSIEKWWGRFVLDMRGSIALGMTQQSLDISGSQVLRTPDQQQAVFVGGLLTTPTNIGSFSRERFSVVPELTFNVGYQLSTHLRAYVGYNFLYWSRVIRPGGQVDTVVDVTQVPNPPGPGIRPSGQNRPAVLFTESDLWVQGINFGIQARW